MKIKSVYGDVTVGRTLVDVRQVGRPSEDRLRIDVDGRDTYISLKSVARLCEHLLDILAKKDERFQRLVHMECFVEGRAVEALFPAGALLVPLLSALEMDLQCHLRMAHDGEQDFDGWASGPEMLKRIEEGKL